MKIGDKIIEIDINRRDKETELTVVHVGRRWATLSNDEKVDINTLQLKGETYGRSYYTEHGLVVHHTRERLRTLLSDAIYKTRHIAHHDAVELVALLETALGKKKTSIPT
jgi:hypothetical protein